MQTRSVLVVVVVSFITVLLASQANAQLGIYGWSSLCFAGDFKVGLNEGTFAAVVTDAEVECACINKQSSNDNWHAGTGNAGGAVAELDVRTTEDKEKGIVQVSGCFTDTGEPDGRSLLDVYSDHDADDHIHVCHASDPNKREVADSCIITNISLVWTIEDKKGRLKYAGENTCEWNGLNSPLGTDGRLEDGRPVTYYRNCELCLEDPDNCPVDCTFNCSVATEGKP